MRAVIISLSLILLTLTSCTTTEIRSFPNNSGIKKKYARIIVEMEMDDLVKKDTLEKELVSKLQENGVMSSQMTEFINPLDKEKNKKISAIVKEYEIDGLLKIRFIGEKTSTQVSSTKDYSNPNFSSSKNFSNPNPNYGMTIQSTNMSETSLQCELIDTKNWMNVWSAGTITSGQDIFLLTARNAAAKIVEQLKADGLI